MVLQQPAWVQPGTHGSLCLQSFPAAARKPSSPGRHAWQTCHPPGWRQPTLCCLFWALLLTPPLQCSQRLKRRAWLTPCSRCQSIVPMPMCTDVLSVAGGCPFRPAGRYMHL